jgi:hypothetical protein
MTIHWKALEQHLLMVNIFFYLPHFGGMHFPNFSQKTSVLKVHYPETFHLLMSSKLHISLFVHHVVSNIDSFRQVHLRSNARLH